MSQDIKRMETVIGQLQNLISRYTNLLDAEHPNRCTECGGTGGKMEYYCGGGYEPSFEEWYECNSCIDQGKHPLDTTRVMTEEESDAWDGLSVEENHPIISKINELEVRLNDAQMYLEQLKMEEAQREELEREHKQAMRESAEDEKSYWEFYSDYN